MSVKLRKLLIAFLSAFFAVCLFATATTVVKTNASTDTVELADYVSTFVMQKGASVRLNESNPGIRFTSTISKEQYDAVVEHYGEANVKMGTLIAPKDLLDGKELSLSSGLVEGEDYVTVERVVWGTQSDSETYYFNAVLSDLPTTNYDRTFVARAYIQVNGEVVYAADYDEDGRSAAYVANAAKLEESVSGDLVDAYVNSTSYTNAALNVSDITVHVGETATVSATVSGTSGENSRNVSVYPDLSTESGNITITGNTVKGVSVGTATVTATYNGLAKDITVTVEEAKVLSNGTYLSYEDSGADFNLNVPDGDVRILQLSDTQIYDSTQEGNRLNVLEQGKWADLEANVFSYMDAVVSEANPHFIILIGDNVGGEFDAEFKMLDKLIEKLDSYGIYWSFVFGNHDREYVDIATLMSHYAQSEYLLYKQNVYLGDSNYTVNIKQNGEYIRTLYLLDTNLTYNRLDTEPQLSKISGMSSIQLNWLERAVTDIKSKIGNEVPASAYMHVRTSVFDTAAMSKYSISVGDTLELTSANAKDGDFGCLHGEFGRESDKWATNKENRFLTIIKGAGVDSVNVGHNHVNNASILYEGIRYTYGLKTSTYDGYQKGELGGTLTTLDGTNFNIEHIYYLKDRNVENFDNLTFGDSRHAYGSLMDMQCNEEIVLSSTDSVDEVPSTGSGKALKAVRTAGETATYNFVQFITNRSFEAGKSYKVSFDFRGTDGVTFYMQIYSGTATISTQSGFKNGLNKFYFEATTDYSNIMVYIGSGFSTDNYTMYIDNLSVVEGTKPDTETFDDMEIIDGTGYGEVMRMLKGTSANTTWSLTDDVNELPVNGSGKALKIVNSGATHTFNFVRIVGNKTVTTGKTYVFEFDLKIINGTYNGNLQICNDGAVLKTLSGVNASKHYNLSWVATQDINANSLVLQFTDGESSNAYTVTIDNIKISEIDLSTFVNTQSEDFENAVIMDETLTTKIYGGIYTVINKTSDGSWTLPEYTVSTANGVLALDISVVQNNKVATFINFNFGKVEAGTYTISWEADYKVTSGNTPTMHYRLTSSEERYTTDTTIKTNVDTTVKDTSFTFTFTEDYDNVALVVIVQNVMTGDTPNYYSAYFDNVTLTKVQ